MLLSIATLFCLQFFSFKEESKLSFHCKSWYRSVPYHMVLYKPKERIKIVLSIEPSFRGNGSMVWSLFGTFVWSLFGITMILGSNLLGSKWKLCLVLCPWASCAGYCLGLSLLCARGGCILGCILPSRKSLGWGHPCLRHIHYKAEWSIGACPLTYRNALHIQFHCWKAWKAGVSFLFLEVSKAKDSMFALTVS